MSPLNTRQLFIVINDPVLFWGKNPVIHQRSKYIEINKGSILLESIETEKNVANVFMKPMTRIKLNPFRKIIVGN